MNNFAVPQTDTGGLEQEFQGKRKIAVQGTRQQKLGVTSGDALPRISEVLAKDVKRLFN